MALGRPAPGFIRLLVPVLTAVATLHCGPTEDDGDGGRPPPSASRDGGAVEDDGGTPPGDAGSTCTPSCSGKSCGPDGCGRACGICWTGTACDSAGQCAATCTPSCSRNTCGSDGCGGSCGSCSSGEACEGGRCVCVPKCNGRQCGPDGCGGTCGTCRSGTTCSESGACVCVPQCQDKVCGSDGCGGTCGTCPANSTCNAGGESCACAAGYAPNQAGTGCVRIGGSCQGINQYGYCAGDTWVRCDAQEGIVALNCGPGQCKRIAADGSGACRCGSIDANGVCASATGASVANPRVHFSCAASAGVLIASNCATETNSPAGFCSTFVTAFGSQTSCFCNTCSAPNVAGQCRPLCATPSDCRYFESGNFHTCGF